jgi:hypothetical protein
LGNSSNVGLVLLPQILEGWLLIGQLKI